MNHKKYIPFFVIGLVCLLIGGLIGGLITNKKIQRVDVKKIETAKHRAIVGMLDQLSWDLISHTADYCRDGLYEADTTKQGLYQRAECPEHWELNYYSDQWGMRKPKSLPGKRETYSNHPTDYTIHVVAEFLKKINTKRNKESSLIEEGYRDEIIITDNEYFEKLIIGKDEYVIEEPVVVATETFVVNRTAEDYARERRELQKSIDDVLSFLNNNIDSNSVDYE